MIIDTGIGSAWSAIVQAACDARVPLIIVSWTIIESIDRELHNALCKLPPCPPHSILYYSIRKGTKFPPGKGRRGAGNYDAYGNAVLHRLTRANIRESLLGKHAPLLPSWLHSKRGKHRRILWAECLRCLKTICICICWDREVGYAVEWNLKSIKRVSRLRLPFSLILSVHYRSIREKNFFIVPFSLTVVSLHALRIYVYMFRNAFSSSRWITLGRRGGSISRYREMIEWG